MVGERVKKKIVYYYNQWYFLINNNYMFCRLILVYWIAYKIQNMFDLLFKCIIPTFCPLKMYLSWNMK